MVTIHDVIVMLLATINDLGHILLAYCNHYTLKHFGFRSVLFCFLK